MKDRDPVAELKSRIYSIKSEIHNREEECRAAQLEIARLQGKQDAFQTSLDLLLKGKS